MDKQYGGVNNKKSLDEIEEAVVVSAPVFRKALPRSKVGFIIGWAAYYFATWIIVSLFMAIIGVQDHPNTMPLWVELWLLPSLPFLLTVVYVLHKARKWRKATPNKSADTRK